MIDITGLDKGEVLAALINGGSPMGMGVLHYRTVTPDEVRIHAQYGYVDYCCGVPIKSDLRGDSFEERLYDRDQGDGRAAAIIAALRAKAGA